MNIARTVTLASVLAMLSATGIAYAAKDAAPAAPTAAAAEAPKAVVAAPAAEVKKADTGKKMKHHAKKHHGKKHIKPA
jgi:hypothetical protein